MKTPFPPARLLIAAVACWLPTAALSAKPPSAPAKKPAPPPAAAAASPDPVVHWLAQQNGSPEAITLPLADVVHAVTGKSILPVNPANPADAALVAKLGNALDRVLPGMNKPESPAHVVNRTDEIAAFFEDAIRAFVGTAPGLSCPAGDDAGAPAHSAGGFPAVRVVDAASGKSYYLGVTLYPTGGREAAVRALTFHPAEAAARFTDDGACLLVAIETNGKTGKETAFLNWELIDASKTPLHAALTFEASQGDAHPPGAVLTDGRKGRD